MQIVQKVNNARPNLAAVSRCEAILSPSGRAIEPDPSFFRNWVNVTRVPAHPRRKAPMLAQQVAWVLFCTWIWAFETQFGLFRSTMTDTRRRVKLYALNADRQWDDRGTGHVFSSYVDRLKGMSLLVRAELDGSLLLESKIQPDTAYQKQQDTLIVWSEGENFDLALSFQEKAGCDEIWEKICHVQGKDPSVDITQDTVEVSLVFNLHNVKPDKCWSNVTLNF